MKNLNTPRSRRSFLTASAMAGGGLMISFSWLKSFANPAENIAAINKVPTGLNGFLKIAEDGVITIISPNPEGGQNVKTSMPMIVAEELDVEWKNVIVEQAPLNTAVYTRQYIGGSQAIRTSWKTLRTAGASARLMLRQAASEKWKVPVDEVTTEKGVIYHKKTGQLVSYGAVATAAAKLPVPKDVKFKEKSDFVIIGTSPKNVEGANIVAGKPLFGLDIRREGMLIAMIVHPPAFGLKMKSMDDSAAKAMPGISAIFPIKVFNEDFKAQMFDTCTFPEVIAVVGNNTWNVMNAKKALKVEWELIHNDTVINTAYDGNLITPPSSLESTVFHKARMAVMKDKPGRIVRKDGDAETAFTNAAKIIERTYTAPFLAHNCMEPMNFFAHVTADKAELAGPLQKPEITEKTLAARLGMAVEKIDIQLTRLGGGFGRRSYAHWLIEAALISQKVNAPVKLMYSREDDMTSGIYRPTYSATYRAALNSNNDLVAFHVKAGGIPDIPLAANSFPAGAVDNYLAESWSLPSNITTGSFRAPRSNFMASAEQSFMDELAEAAGKDPITFRLELLDRASKTPVGKNNDYDASRYAAVLIELRENQGGGKRQMVCIEVLLFITAITLIQRRCLTLNCRIASR